MTLGRTLRYDLPVKYTRPPFPIPLFKKFCDTARKLGYLVRGQRWQLLDFLLDYAAEYPTLFRKRP